MFKLISFVVVLASIVALSQQASIKSLNMSMINMNGSMIMNSSQTADMLKTICTQEQNVNTTLYSLEKKDVLIPMIDKLKTSAYTGMVACWNNASFVNQSILSTLKSSNPKAYANMLSVTGLDGANNTKLMKSSFCALANQTQSSINQFTASEKVMLNSVFQGMFKCLNGTMPATFKQIAMSNMGQLSQLVFYPKDFTKITNLMKQFGVEPSKLMSMF